MSGRVPKGPPSRGGNERKKGGINFDLNLPATENNDEETSTCPSGSNVVPNTQGVPPQIVPIDVDLTDDDDVLISSPRTFAKAKQKSRRQRLANAGTSSGSRNHTHWQRASGKQQVVNLESGDYISGGNDVRYKEQVPEAPPPPPPPPPPNEPVFKCPICRSSMVDECSTKCGHIFCKVCIDRALAKSKKCPVCGKKARTSNTFRVFLPSPNND